MARAKEPELMADLLPGVKVPVHVLIGGAPKGSGLPPAQFQLLKATLPQLVVDTVPGSGLRIHEEQPGVVVQAVLDLLKQLGRGERAVPATCCGPAPSSAPARSSPR